MARTYYHLLPLSKEIAMTSLQWTCAKCSARMWLHYYSCATCGAAKPEPPPEPPADTRTSFDVTEPPTQPPSLRRNIHRPHNPMAPPATGA
jgi:hypothetical protein